MSELKPSLKDNVFINCPFDRKYKPIFNAIVFAIHDAGFVARCSLEVVDSGPTRLATILSIIAECTYGIHDISRTEVGGKTKLPRFNMPFECGLFGGGFSYGGESHKRKRILVLDSEDYRYRASISDIAGQDIKAHNNNPRIASIRSVVGSVLDPNAKPSLAARQFGIITYYSKDSSRQY